MAPGMFLQVALCNHPHIQSRPDQAVVPRIQHWCHNTYQAGIIYCEASDLCPWTNAPLVKQVHSFLNREIYPLQPLKFKQVHSFLNQETISLQPLKLISSCHWTFQYTRSICL